MTIDDLELPAFLRRDPTERLTKAQLRVILSPQPWAPFRVRQETEMAKANVYCDNRAAEVRVFRMRDGEAPVFRFDDMDTFEAWYSPKLHGEARRLSSSDRETSIAVDTPERQAPKLSTPKAVAGSYVALIGPKCLYCGNNHDDGRDHFPPKAFGSGGVILPSCNRCNSTAGTTWPNDLRKRVAYVQSEVASEWDAWKYLDTIVRTRVVAQRLVSLGVSSGHIAAAARGPVEKHPSSTPSRYTSEAAPATATTSTPRDAASSGPTSRRQTVKDATRERRYMDPRHVTALETAGWKQTSSWPMTFQRGDDRVTFPLPGEAKWSSNWEFRGQAGRGVGQLFKLTGDQVAPR